MSNGNYTGGNNVMALDADLTTLIAQDMALAQTLQGVIQSIAAAATMKPNYTISGPTGAQTIDWQGLILGLTTQIDAITTRLERWFKLKQTNMPFFNLRKGR